MPERHGQRDASQRQAAAEQAAEREGVAPGGALNERADEQEDEQGRERCGYADRQFGPPPGHEQRDRIRDREHHEELAVPAHGLPEMRLERVSVNARERWHRQHDPDLKGTRGSHEYRTQPDEVPGRRATEVERTKHYLAADGELH